MTADIPQAFPAIDAEKIAALDGLDPLERAAALSHLVYSETIDRPDVTWATTLARDWADLHAAAKVFNEQLVETWAANPELFEDWVASIRGLLPEAGRAAAGADETVER